MNFQQKPRRHNCGRVVAPPDVKLLHWMSLGTNKSCQNSARRPRGQNSFLRDKCSSCALLYPFTETRRKSVVEGVGCLLRSCLSNWLWSPGRCAEQSSSNVSKESVCLYHTVYGLCECVCVSLASINLFPVYVWVWLQLLTRRLLGWPSAFTRRWKSSFRFLRKCTSVVVEDVILSAVQTPQERSCN